MWYYERRVPSDIVRNIDALELHFQGRKLWRRSLQTRNQTDALERAYDVATEYEALVAAARGVPRQGAANPIYSETLPARVLTGDDYKAIGFKEHHRFLRPWQQISVRSNANQKIAAEFKAKGLEYLANRAPLLTRIAEPGLDAGYGSDAPSPLARAREINIEHGYNMTIASDQFGVLVGIIRDAMIRADKDIVAIIGGALVPPSAGSALTRDAAKVAGVREVGSDRVFPDWYAPVRKSEDGEKETQWASAKWTKAFNRTVVPAALNKTLNPDTRQEVTLHSFRGSFKRLLEDSGMSQQYVDDIIGHEKNELDRRYSGTRDISLLYEHSHKLDYAELKLTNPRPVLI